MEFIPVAFQLADSSGKVTHKLNQCLIQSRELYWTSMGMVCRSLWAISHYKLWLWICFLYKEKLSFQGCQSGTIQKERLHFRKGERNLFRKDWFGETKRAANFVCCLLSKNIVNESMILFSVNCGEGSIMTWVSANFVLVPFLKINSDNDGIQKK